MAAHKIAGEWRGHYVHLKRPGDSFTAFIYENEGQIDGTVIDDSGPGPATMTGSFSFPGVVFTKVYDRPGAVRDVEKIGDQTIVTIRHFGPPIEYEGTMSDDGKTMGGTWVINAERGVAGAGSWTAYRVDEEESKESKETGKRVKRPEVVDPIT
jgi:hypothetical protein